jgi:putative endonuclease
VASARPGREGEDLACEYLKRAGLKVVERNYRCRGGEIDIVARDGATVVFVEVKERGGSSHGTAVEAVTREKRRRLLRAARLYAATHGLSESLLRFDVVSIDPGPSGPRIRHDAGAFGEE